MEQNKHYLQARQFVLIPTEPVLDFGTIEPDETAAPQTFIVDMVADKVGTIAQDADWLLVSPQTFSKGQTKITVQLVKENLRRGESHQAQVTVAVGEEKEIIDVRVRVLRYSEEEIASMEARLDPLEKQLEKQVQQAQKLQVKTQAIDFGEVKSGAPMPSQTVRQEKKENIPKQRSSPMKISMETANKLIAEEAKHHGIKGYQKVQKAGVSSFGTESFCAHVNDGKGILYCHATGNYAGQVFYVRKGIGYHYKRILGGASSYLGLPLSNEYDSKDGNKRSDFEGGYIKWIASQNKLQIYRYTANGEKLVYEHPC